MKRNYGVSSLIAVSLLLVFCFSCKSKTPEISSTIPTNNMATQEPSFTPTIEPIKETPEPIPATPTPTPEPEIFFEGDYEYFILDNGAVIKKYHNRVLYESIPDTLGGYPVVEIGDKAFAGVELHISTLPKTVSKIGNRAFSVQVDSITNLVLPDSVTYIAEEAFYRTPIHSLTLSKNLTYMGARAFSYCNLTSVVIPEGVTYIGEEAFYFNNWGNVLETVSIPSTVSYIGANAFTQHFAAVNIKVSPNNEYYKIQDGALYSIDGTTLYACYYDKNRESFTTPEGVTTIAREAFNMCYNTKVIISAEVKDIEEGAFPDFSVLYVEISDQNKFYKIENGALVTKDGSTLIAFFGDWNSCNIPNTVKRIGDYAFARHSGGYGSIERISIPDSVISIGNNAFEDTDIQKITIPDSVQEIGEYAFYDCDNLTDVKLSEALNELPKGLFFSCSELSEISIPECVKGIGDYAFSSTAIESIIIPNSVIDIGAGAFYSCSKLKQISLPENLYCISDWLFYDCSKLTDIYLNNNDRSKDEDTSTLSGSASIELPGKLINIGDHSFSYCEALTEIAIPEGVRQIGAKAFISCSSLKNIILPDSLSYIGSYAFYNCESLSEIEIPGGVKFIAPETFVGCANLTAVTLKDGVQHLGRRAFDCDNLESIYIPASVVQFDEAVFSGNRSEYNGNLTIYTLADSAANQYAAKRGIVCVIN